MKFVKGMLIGGLVSAGVAMIYAGTMEKNKKRVIKKGKQFARKLGIM